ncbi:MAG: Alkaline phosphatase synthesis transcriptional regulatory protein SphR [Chloroflexi bacterium ADurb.Bin325]|nr:MAG: Alkaline phosphatase synthesis transcriptional regulatory protein SphR [Chloroflexi bacterium ADurb.Bin325]
MPPRHRDWIYLPRQADLAALFAGVRNMACVSVVGVSNLGKSATMRALAEPQVQAHFLGEDAASYLFIYIDFNQMLEMSDQAFYELVLRLTIDALRQNGVDVGLLRQIEKAYTGVIAPASAFEIPLRFAQAMSALGEQLSRRVVFLFDEVDEPVEGIDSRVFLNLRALKDRHHDELTYITATNRLLNHIRSDPALIEFAELFGHQILYISLLQEEEICRFVERFASEEGVTFSDGDIAFIRSWGGGHPVLMETACRILGLVTGQPVRDASQEWIIHRRAAEMLAQDLNLQAESRKIWNNLSEREQAALLTVCEGGEAAQPELDLLVAKHLVRVNGSERWLFCRAFEEFVQRQHVAQRPGQQGIRVDPDSGEVWVANVRAPTLTNLEYRLLLLLYGRIDKICTKYEVVEAVWGDDYIGEVDDARIEKLVSRLRQKLEPDPANPKYLFTVRGRGYRLVDS